MKNVILILSAVAAGAMLLWLLFLSSNDKQNVVGVILPLTGPVADDGNATLAGINKAMESIVKDVDYVVVDGQYDPRITLNAFNYLLNTKKIQSLIVYGVVPAEVLKPLLIKNKIPVYAIAVGEEDFPNAEIPFRRVWFPVRRIGKVMGESATRGFCAKSVSAIGIDNSYGIESVSSFCDSVELNGGTVVDKEKFSMNDNDLRNQIAKMLSHFPDAIYVTGFGQGYITAINQIREVGFKGMIFTDTAIVDPQVRGNIKDLKNIIFADAASRNNLGRDVALQTLFGYDAALLAVGEKSNDIDYSQLNSGIIGYSESGEVRVPIAIKMFKGDIASTVKVFTE